MISCKVDLGTLLKRLQQVPRDAQRIIETAIDTDAKGFVKDIVAITPPSMGKANVESKKRGESAVKGDIWKVYGTLYEVIESYGGAKLARQYWWIIKNKPESLAAFLAKNAPGTWGLQRGWDEGAEHQRRRARNGRVTGRRPTVIIDQAEIPKVEAYIKAQQKRVGLLAAGFKPAASALKVSLPAWVMRHAANIGTIRIHRAIGQYGITISNRARHGSKNDLPRRIRYVLQSDKRKKRLIHRIRAEIRAVLKKQRLLK